MVGSVSTDHSHGWIRTRAGCSEEEDEEGGGAASRDEGLTDDDDDDGLSPTGFRAEESAGSLCRKQEVNEHDGLCEINKSIQTADHLLIGGVALGFRDHRSLLDHLVRFGRTSCSTKHQPIKHLVLEAGVLILWREDLSLWWNYTNSDSEEVTSQTCERGRADKLGLAAARVDDVLLDQVAGDLHHRVKRTLQDLLRPITDQLTRRLRHFLFIRLHEFSQLSLRKRKRGGGR